MDQKVTIAQLRWFEFRRVFSASAILAIWLRRRPTLRSVRYFVWAGIIVAYLWLYASMMRGRSLDWTSASGGLRAAAWLLWGLGGLDPVAVAVIAGWAWRERLETIRPSSRAMPVLELLPLSHRQVLVAKLSGRLAAFGVALVTGLGILAVARWLMGVGALVQVVPSLLDPWLVASPLVFYGLFVASASAAAGGRSGAPGVVGVRLGSLGLGVPVGLLVTYASGLSGDNDWVVAVWAAAVAVWATVAVAVQSLPGWRRLEAGLGETFTRPIGAYDAETAAPRKGLSAWLEPAVRGASAVGFRALPGTVGQAGPWLRRSVAFALAMLVGVTLLGLLWEAGTLAWCLSSHLSHDGRAMGDALKEAEGAFMFGIALVPVLFGAAIVLVPFSAWQEVLSCDPGAGGRAYPSALFTPRHLGFLVPTRVRSLWHRRLVSVLIVSVLLTAAGIASHQIAWRIGTVSVGDAVATVGPVMYWVFPAASLVSLCCFGFLPLLRWTAKTVEPVRNLVPGALVVGGLAGLVVIPIIVLGQALTVVACVVAVSVAWCVMLLGTSCWWCEPDRWPLSASGGASIGNRMRAAFVVVAMAVTLACWSGLVVGCAKLVHGL